MKSKLFFILLLPLFLLPVSAIRFDIENNCSYTLWPAVLPHGGGRRLDSGQSWSLDFPDGPRLARIWARTNCSFDSSGRGSCLTGDCGGQLNCSSYGSPPLSKAEYGLNNFAHRDYYDVSLSAGFTVPLQMTPTSNNCSKSVRCSADVVAQCPDDLRAPGGCHNPCTVYKTPEYCCRAGTCLPTDKSRYFKGLCPETFTYPEDDPTSTFTCPEGTNYRVVFCP